MDKPKEIFLKDYTQPNFWCEEVELEFDIFDEETFVKNTSRYKVNESTDGKTLKLNGVDLELVSISVNGEPVSEDRYHYDNNLLEVSELPSEFELCTKVRFNPYKNFTGEGLYKSGSILCTQCEAEGFRRITFHQDRPDVMSKFKTKIIADKKRFPILLSNGNLLERVELDEGRHSATWEDPFNKPSYLFALVAGDLEKVSDTYKTKDGRTVGLEIYVDPGNSSKCSYAMESLKKSMKWDEERFGLIYDLDIYMIVAVDSFNMGAMENKGLNIFNSHYVLASKETATDSDFLGVEAVIGHEYFHNWTGNRVTCRDWFQLTLKEGLTVFRDQEFSSDMNSRAVKRIEDIARLKVHQFPEDQSSLSHPIQPKSYIEINNFYTATVYEKGAEVIRMIHTLIGEKKFRAGIDLYFERFDGQAVTCEDFVQAMSDASGVDLTHFKVWYDQNGTPEVSITTTYDEEAKNLTIEFSQNVKTNNSEFDSLHIPLRLELISNEGKVLDTGDHSLLELKNKTEKVVLTDITKGCVPAFNGGFTAPVKINYDYSERALTLLMKSSKDFYVRYDAAEQVKESEIKRLVDSIKANNTPVVSESFLSAYKSIVEDGYIDKSFKAHLLALPTEKELFHKWDSYSFEGTKKALRILKTSIAKEFKGEFESFVGDFLNEKEEYVVNPVQVGKRALFNQCISFLGYLDDSSFFKKMYDLLVSADNMTIEFGALKVLLSHESEYSEKASDHFYQKWKHETLVTQKWLTLSTQSELVSVTKLETLEKLPEYDEKVPNLVRSLIGAFSNNIFAVNSKDGEGYKFLARKIQEIDSFNPQIAARIAKNLNYIDKLDSDRANILRSELKKVLESGKLSNDSFEVINAIVS